MILVLGATGYIGEAFCRELGRRRLGYRALSRATCNYTDFDVLKQVILSEKADLVINAAGFTGRPNVDACEGQKAETLWGNTLFPQVVAMVCLETGTALGHISSGCIYSGAKVMTDEGIQVRKDLMAEEVKSVIEGRKGADGGVYGFTEEDGPNFSFRDPPCSFYSGSKALGEEAIMSVYGLNGGGPLTAPDSVARKGSGAGLYLWRLRIPFDEEENPRNYLTKLQRYPRLYDNFNSLSHRGDFVSACLDLWEKHAPSGIYNVTNPGFVRTRYVAGKIKEVLGLEKDFEFWRDDLEFYEKAAKTPRSNCIMDVSKLLDAGVFMRPVQDALQEAVGNWRSVPSKCDNESTCHTGRRGVTAGAGVSVG